jgi:hypothetical protein
LLTPSVFSLARLLDSHGDALNFAPSCVACSLDGDQVHVLKLKKNSRCSLTVPISMPP